MTTKDSESAIREIRDLFDAILAELEKDPELARRVISRRAQPRSTVRRRRNPPSFDPFEVGRGGADVLRHQLRALNVEQLKDIVSEFGIEPRSLALRWKSKERLVALVFDTVTHRLRKGDAFLGHGYGERNKTPAELVPASAATHRLTRPHPTTSAPQVLYAQSAFVGLDNVGEEVAHITDVEADSPAYGRLKTRPPTAIAPRSATEIEVFIPVLSRGTEVRSGDEFNLRVRYRTSVDERLLNFGIQYLGRSGWNNLTHSTAVLGTTAP